METTNVDKIKREKLLNALDKIEKNLKDEDLINSLALIKNEINKKKYGLFWEEHKERVDQELETKIPVLKENKKKRILESKEKDFNFLIEGDNLHSLYILNKTHKENIDVIYIDPPYNTGKKDFIYNDKIVENEDGYKHSKWLSFLEKRLRLAQKLLKPSGIIFISIDDNELAELKLLCDSIFDERNFISILSIENNPKGRKNSNFISTSNEYCLIYAKNKDKSYFLENIPKSIKDLSKDEDGNYVHNSGKRILVGKNEFNEEVKDFSSDKHYSVYYNKETNDMILRKEAKTSDEDEDLKYAGYERYYSYKNNHFVLNTYSYHKFYELFQKNALAFKDKKIYEKNYSTMIRMKSMVINKSYKAIINNKEKDFQIDVKTTSAGTELKKIFNTDIIPFNNPKNTGLIKLLLSLIENKNALVLDFFAGSGTTAQAVLELNKEDKGNRRFILCNNNENNICEDITYERIKRVIKGYADVKGLPANLKYLKTNYIPRENSEKNNIYTNTLKDITNLIELENGQIIDDTKICLFKTEDEIDNFSQNINALKECEKVYITSDILLTKKEEEILEQNNISMYIIPEYYFKNEITEVL